VSARMDFFDRILPKPVRTEAFTFYSKRSPEALVHNMQEVFDRTRGFVFTPNLTGEFVSAYEFNAQPKWSLLVINKANTGPAVRMKGEVSGHGSGSLVEVELTAHWTLALFVLLPPAIALVGLIMVPKEHLSGITPKDAGIAMTAILFIPMGALISAWLAKRLFKQNFVACFKLAPFRKVED